MQTDRGAAKQAALWAALREEETERYAEFNFGLFVSRVCLALFVFFCCFWIQFESNNVVYLDMNSLYNNS